MMLEDTSTYFSHCYCVHILRIHRALSEADGCI